jgi:FkbM family methyltransferase
MTILINRVSKAYRKRGLFGLVLAFITYPYRRLNLRSKYLDLCARYYLLRGKTTLTFGNVKVPFLVSQLTDATGLCHTYKWERFIWLNILRELKPNDVFWDVGANIGFYSLLASSCPGVIVIAFEPNPATVKVLRKNIELNKRPDIRVLNIALSESVGMSRFDTIQRDSTSARAHLANEETDGTIEVAANRGDTLVESGDVPKPDVLKIDVEGAEYLVVKGMGDALSSCRLIFCEVHSRMWRYGSSMDDFEMYLKNVGFLIEKKTKVPGYDTYHIIARRS